MADHFVTDRISLLEYLNDLSLSVRLIVDVHYGIVQIGIECLSKCFDLRCTEFGERFRKAFCGYLMRNNDGLYVACQR